MSTQKYLGKHQVRKKQVFKSWKSGKKWLFSVSFVVVATGAGVSSGLVAPKSAQAETTSVTTVSEAANSTILADSQAISSAAAALSTASNTVLSTSSNLTTASSAYSSAAVQSSLAANSLSSANSLVFSDQSALSSASQTASLAMTQVSSQVNQISQISQAVSSDAQAVSQASTTVSFAASAVQNAVIAQSLAELAYSQATLALASQSVGLASLSAAVVATAQALSQAETILPPIVVPSGFNNFLMSNATVNSRSTAANSSVAALMSQGLALNSLTTDAGGNLILSSAFVSSYFSNSSDLADTILFTSSAVAMTASQQSAIDIYAAALINQVRSQFGNGLLIPTEGMINFADQVQLNKLSDGWNTLSIGWHDVDAINSAASQYGLTPSYTHSVDDLIKSAAAAGVSPASWNQYYENAFLTMGYQVTNMAQLKRYVYESVIQFLFQDGPELFGHTQFVTGYNYGQNASAASYMGVALTDYNFPSQMGVAFQSVKTPLATTSVAASFIAVPNYSSVTSSLSSQFSSQSVLLTAASSDYVLAQSSFSTAKTTLSQALGGVDAASLVSSSAANALSSAQMQLALDTAALSSANDGLVQFVSAASTANSLVDSASAKLQSDQLAASLAASNSSNLTSLATSYAATFTQAQMLSSQALATYSEALINFSAATQKLADDLAGQSQTVSTSENKLLSVNESTKQAETANPATQVSQGLLPQTGEGDTDSSFGTLTGFALLFALFSLRRKKNYEAVHKS